MGSITDGCVSSPWGGDEMSETPNYYSTAHLMSATSCQWGGSTWATDTLAFGFVATGLRVLNSCGDPLYYSLKGYQPLTTGDGYIAGCSALQIESGLRIGGMTLMTTSSSCTSRPRVGITAWGSA
mgnify:CR=1 FL=1